MKLYLRKQLTGAQLPLAQTSSTEQSLASRRESVRGFAGQRCASGKSITAASACKLRIVSVTLQTAVAGSAGSAKTMCADSLSLNGNVTMLCCADWSPLEPQVVACKTTATAQGVSVCSAGAALLEDSTAAPAVLSKVIRVRAMSVGSSQVSGAAWAACRAQLRTKKRPRQGDRIWRSAVDMIGRGTTRDSLGVKAAATLEALRLAQRRLDRWGQAHQLRDDGELWWESGE